MSDKTTPNPLRPPWLVLGRAEQVVIAGCVCFCLVAMTAYFVHQGGLRGRIIEIDRVDPTTVRFKVDVNSAAWPELVQLPDVGETLARRIVEHRKQNGPFTSPNDLQNVEGIGPKTVEQMRPYLLPLRLPDKVAGSAP